MSLDKNEKKCIKSEKYVSWKSVLEACLDDITELDNSNSNFNFALE